MQGQGESLHSEQQVAKLLQRPRAGSFSEQLGSAGQTSTNGRGPNQRLPRGTPRKTSAAHCCPQALHRKQLFWQCRAGRRPLASASQSPLSSPACQGAAAGQAFERRRGSRAGRPAGRRGRFSRLDKYFFLCRSRKGRQQHHPARGQRATEAASTYPGPVSAPLPTTIRTTSCDAGYDGAMLPRARDVFGRARQIRRQPARSTHQDVDFKCLVERWLVQAHYVGAAVTLS